ncbi:acetyl-CoA hydrolase/transferase C-terminal domain-containing protein [Actinomadura luteofluorescens]|uniref:acetyl-CoA hydrolase/transferase family protein n=1 Tax=Actinomadura luteofluorescens TaxID=46163 RepID=UPI0021641633|nr:acetyl-CoA hydrolase/transferase C-terminal domain-containing protein [Actinomadura glauciflava]MCR3744279.1 Acyl-CoA hydrolase [Actinomadura glauciflava]
MRVVSQEDLARVLGGLPGRPRIVAGGNFAAPRRALQILDAAVAEYRLFMLNAQTEMPEREGVDLETPFVGAGMRGRANLRYFPSRLSLVPNLLKDSLPPDVVIVQTSPPVGGTVSLGIEVNILPAAIEAVRARGGLVVAQINPRMPYTFGDAVLATDEVDLAIEDDEPLATPVPRPPGEVAHEIGERVARLVPRDATLQLGIGAIPDAVLSSLLDRRGLRVWSEMFSDGVLALEKAGALDTGTPITASFAFGSPELYAWADRNDRIRMLRTEKTNDPSLIARRPRMVSVNSALQVDLFAQANASRVRGTIYSGFGGQTDFVVGALHSPGGHAVIALPSWHPRADVSTVIARLTGPVTSFQHSYIVSERGSATVWGNDAASQAQQIIDNVAHPSARDELREQGRDLGFPLR